MSSLHISTVRKILQSSEAVDLKCWTKSGAILELHNAIPLRYNFYEGTQQFKIPASVHFVSEDVVLLTDSICILHAVVRDRNAFDAFDRHGYEYYYGHINGERREFITRLDTIPPLHELIRNTLDFYEQEYAVPRHKARTIAAEYVATITLLFRG